MSVIEKPATLPSTSEPAERIRFTLDGREVEALPGETIWQVAKRCGTRIPHLCYEPEPGYRADGNCRACMVEIEGERVLAASCIREPKPGMKVASGTERAERARRMVFELLAADQPPRETAHDPESKFWTWADDIGLAESRFPRRQAPTMDVSHPAIAVNLDACIHCNLCVRACREVQVNDVIGMAYRGAMAKIVFDFDKAMGESTCVGCGECVQACPTGALMESKLLDTAGKRTVFADKTVDSVCPYCGVGCQTKVYVKDDAIVQVDGRPGPANENRLCVKGRFGYDYVRHPHRLTLPLIRRADAPKAWDDQVDPTDPWTHFRDASWEEALEAAAAGLMRIRDEEGGGALAGFGSAKGSNEEAYLFQKLVRTGFRTNNVDHCTRLCHASSVAALIEGIGSGAVTAPFTAALEADCILVIGAKPEHNHPVAATYLKQAAKRGAKLVILDPRRHGTLARYASHNIQFKPGTDVALLNALLHVIVKEDLVDHAYLQAHTSGFDDLKSRIAPFSPEKMSKICNVPAATIREVARLYATSQRSIVFWGMGISQHVHGTDNARCLIALALATGQIGRPGTGLHPLRGQNNVQGASDAGLIPMVYPDYKSVEDPQTRAHYQAFWGTELDSRAGLTVVEIMEAIAAGQITGMYILGENPAMSDPDQVHARQALAKLDHLVVQDIFLTETAWHADVVLPASSHAEKLGTYTNTNRQVQIGRPALSLPGEARQDWWIVQELARRLGLEWDYAGPEEVFAEMATVMPSLENITWERLERQGSVTYPCSETDGVGQEIMFGERFPTADGRGRIVPVDLLPPDELPDPRFPMVLTTGRMLEHWHTGAMTRRAGVLDDLEPEAVAFLHPLEIREKGLTVGREVRVSTRRGEIDLILRADASVPPGMIFVPFCFNEAAANLLTNPHLDPFGKIPEFKFCAAKVEASEGDMVAAE